MVTNVTVGQTINIKRRVISRPHCIAPLPDTSDADVRAKTTPMNTIEKYFLRFSRMSVQTPFRYITPHNFLRNSCKHTMRLY